MRRLQPPLVPDADEAREWAQRELSRAVYQEEGRSWLEIVLETVGEWLEGLAEAAGGLGIALVPILLLVVIAAVVLAAFVLGGPVRRARRRPGDAVLDEDDERTAEQLRATARAAADRGDLALAVVEMFRALVRGLDERAIGSDTLGRTAQEAAAAATPRLPEHGEGLHAAAVLFDEVRYGRRRPGQPDYARLVELDEAIRRTRPRPAEVVGR